MREVDAIVTGDWHIRLDTPICWVGDFVEVQTKALLHIKALQKKYNCPVLSSGDVFDKSTATMHTLNYLLDYLPPNFYTVYGNHDLYKHQMELVEKTALRVLHKTEMLGVATFGHWGEPSPNHKAYTPDTILQSIKLLHIMTYKGKLPWPGCTAPSAKELLEMYPETRTIFTGHNHHTFMEELDGRLLFNPGSITQQTAGQIDFKPCVGLWCRKDNTIEIEYLPRACEGDITREHLEVEKARSQRYAAFIENCTLDPDVHPNFKDNLYKFFDVNNTHEYIRQRILDWMPDDE